MIDALYGVIGILLLCAYYALIYFFAPNWLRESGIVVAVLCLAPIVWLVVAEYFASAIVSVIFSLVVSFGFIASLIIFGQF